MKLYKTADFFAGVGGIRLGFEKTGKFKAVFANDVDEYCKITYDRNFDKINLTLKDIIDIKSKDLPDFDALLAGFPCQPFSIAGYREGFEDKEKGTLFFEMYRIIKDKMPRLLFLENVKNLKSHNEGKTFNVIQESLEYLGYKIYDKVLNTMEYGAIPQNRERIFIVGFRNDIARDIEFKFPKPIPLERSFRDFLEEDIDEYFYYSDRYKMYEKIKEGVKKHDTVYQWRRVYVRENKSNVCPTLTANMGTGGHNVPLILDGSRVRKLTPKECFNLQGFPKEFKLPKENSNSRLYKQAGNSVSVPVVRRIASNIVEALGGVKLDPSC